MTCAQENKNCYVFLMTLKQYRYIKSLNDLQLLQVEEDLIHMNNGIFARVDRTTNALQVSWKTRTQTHVSQQLNLLATSTPKKKLSGTYLVSVSYII